MATPLKDQSDDRRESNFPAEHGNTNDEREANREFRQGGQRKSMCAHE
jgi:hypothetical protein